MVMFLSLIISSGCSSKQKITESNHIKSPIQVEGDNNSFVENDQKIINYIDNSDTVKRDNDSVLECETPQNGSEKIERIVNPFQIYTSFGVYRDLNLLCKRYPEIISIFVIGESTRKNPIKCVKLGKGNKQVCVVSGIHSREHITISFTMKCIEEYAEAYKNNTLYGIYDVRNLLNNYTIFFVPMCNPDGIDIVTSGEHPIIPISNFDNDSYKLNANGVNLNRNFPYNWEQQYGDNFLEPGDEKYPGAYPASECETKALIKLCQEMDFQWLLDMHIIGNGIFWRDNKNRIIDGDWEFANEIAQKCGYQVFDISSDASTYSGGLENWFRFEYGKPALCIEMIPYSQAYYSETYCGYNKYFEKAVNWSETKYTYLEALKYSLNKL